MANNRHAYNRDVLQSYWTADELPIYCNQPTGEKTHTVGRYVKNLEYYTSLSDLFHSDWK
jgi:hypothetical protein